MDSVNTPKDQPSYIETPPKSNSLLYIVLGIILLLIVGGSSYYLGRQSQKLSLPSVSIQPTLAPTPSMSPVSEKTLSIPEFGVKFQLPDIISDAYYDKTDSLDSMNLRVHSLDSEADCKNGNASVAALIRIGKDKINPLMAPDNKKYSETMDGKIIGNYFYYIGLAQYSCIQNPINQPHLDKVRKAFSDTTSTIEKL